MKTENEVNSQKNSLERSVNARQIADPFHSRAETQSIPANNVDPFDISKVASNDKIKNISQNANLTGNQPLKAGPEPVQNQPQAGPPAFDPSPIPPINPIPPTPKPNPATHSELDDLPPETLVKINELLATLTLEAATLEITAKPPYGLGIQTSRSSLQRLLQRQSNAQLIRQRDENADKAAAILAHASESDENFSRAASHLLKNRLLEIALLNKPSPEMLHTLTKSLARLRNDDHAELRLRLAEKRAERLSKTQSKGGKDATQP